jgi:hypothetical protein
MSSTMAHAAQSREQAVGCLGPRRVAGGHDAMENRLARRTPGVGIRRSEHRGQLLNDHLVAVVCRRPSYDAQGAQHLASIPRDDDAVHHSSAEVGVPHRQPDVDRIEIDPDEALGCDTDYPERPFAQSDGGPVGEERGRELALPVIERHDGHGRARTGFGFARVEGSPDGRVCAEQSEEPVVHD